MERKNPREIYNKLMEKIGKIVKEAEEELNEYKGK